MPENAHTYGKAIDHIVRPMAGNVPVEPDSIVNARIYTSTPSEAQIDDSSAALGGETGSAITAWTSEGDHKYKVTFDAITDSTSHAGALWDTWHPVVNFRLVAAGDILFIYRPIVVWRITGQLSHLDVEAVDIYALESDIDDLKGDRFTYDRIRSATTQVLHRVKSLGLNRRDLAEYDLTNAVIYKATELCCKAMRGEGNDFAERAADWKTDYEAIWDQTNPRYDTSGDGLIEPDEKRATSQPVWVVR